MLGKWKGFYKYDNQKFQQNVGFAQTYFTIKIVEFNNDQFVGTVKDDVNSGGMNGTGEIKGEIHNEHIYFEKQMPTSVLVDKDGKSEEINRKHETLFYEGVLIGNNKYSGTWKFNRKWAFIFGFIPYNYSPGTGSWEMELIQD